MEQQPTQQPINTQAPSPQNQVPKKRNTKRLITAIIALIILLAGGYFIARAVMPTKKIAPGEPATDVVAKKEKKSEQPKEIEAKSNEVVTTIEE